MIHSLFIISEEGEIIIERHFRGKVNRTVAEHFVDQVRKNKSPTDTPPIIATATHYLIHVYQHQLFFLAVINTEAPPLMVTELLHRIIDVLKSYMGNKISEALLKQNYATMYQVLDELIDNGFPITTEVSLLHDLIRPSVDIVSSAVQALAQPSTGVARSPVPWRKLGIRYANNEIFFDLIEEMNSIVDCNSTTVVSEVFGRVNANCKLSGMPDLLLQFKDPSIIEDCSFHPCVRYARYEQDRAISFVPPDGEFELLNYRISNVKQDFIYCRPQLTFYDTGCNISIMFGAKPGLGTKTLEDVRIHIPMPAPVDQINVTASQGSFFFDSRAKELRWDIGKVQLSNTKASPNVSGKVSFSTKISEDFANNNGNGAVSIDWKIQNSGVSDLKVDQVNLKNENYKPFKGVRYIAQSGKFEVRTV